MMRARGIIGAVSVALLACGCASPATVIPVSADYARGQVEPLNPQAALAEINSFRKANGVPPVVMDSHLMRAASLHSQDQARAGLMSHGGTDGSRPVERAVKAGYRPTITSENVAAGYKSFEDVMRGWEGSPHHRENLLRPSVTEIGVAMAQSSAGRAYWTLMLGTE